MIATIPPELSTTLGIAKGTAAPETYFAWLLELIRKHGRKGMWYAIGLKINSAVDHGTTSSTATLSSSEHAGFRLLVLEVLSWNDCNSGNLVDLLSKEYSWAVCYVKDLVPNVREGALPAIVPTSTWELNKRLAFEFRGEGMAYALRYFLLPAYHGAIPPAARCPHLLKLFLEEINGSGGHGCEILTRTLDMPEFAASSHLFKEYKLSATAPPILGLSRLSI